MENLKIGIRQGIGFAVIVSLIIFMVIFALWQLASIQQSVERISKNNYVKTVNAYESLGQMKQVLRSIDMIVMSKDHEARMKEKEKIEAARGKYRDAMKKIEEMEGSPKGKEIFERMKAAVKPAAEANNKAVALAMEGKNTEAADILVKEANPLVAHLFNIFEEMQAYQQEQVNFSYKQAVVSYERVRLMLIAVSAVVIMTALFFSFFLTLSITRPLARMLHILKDIADGDGDLTRRLDINRKDEMGEIARLFNQSWDKLDKLVAEIIEHSTLVGTCAGQLAIASHHIERNSRQIAGQSTAVATAGEEMSATSTDIARNCSMAAGNSMTANEAAEKGQAVVHNTITRMNAIKRELEGSSHVIERLGQSSERIGQIADTIQDIADQTNLLALNAAIEAARAGDQGRGFAVVADEVRALAERTAKATREIANMTGSIQAETGQAVLAMQRSVEEVAAGVYDANESGTALGHIIGQIGEVTTQVSQIATAAKEQTATTVEVVSNIGSISDSIMNFKNAAASVKERVGQLTAVAEKLKTTTSSFKVDLGPLTILDVAKHDHVLFVNRIARCFDGKETVQPNNLPDHTGCRFGKWYFSHGKELCNHSPTFHAINDPHQKIHRIAREVVELTNKGENARAEEKLLEVENISSTIVSMLEQVKQECNLGENRKAA